MKKLHTIFLFFISVCLFAQNNGYKLVETANNDPMHAKIYKLDNGLTVYISVNKDAPRVYTNIAVKAGSKNDPSDATGLAHYLEHMLFKGTDKFGTTNYALEKPILDKIEQMYEVYRKTTDEPSRKKIYHQIDSLSLEASKISIANEYDKMMASIGVKGSNAYTSSEQTVYIADIPSNQLEKWLTIEAERFRNPVMRIFHTELEAVYEEKNRSLDNDNYKVYDALYASLFQKHTYGTQTTLGTIEHLKNPSITRIREYLKKYYVPNNIAICMSGDIDPEATVQLIAKKFGDLKSQAVESFNPPVEKTITAPISKEVFGPDAESLMMGYRFPGVTSKDVSIVTIIDKLLANGTAGLLDLNLVQQQKVLNAGTYIDPMKDYSVHAISGEPKEGQTLEQVRDLILGQIEILKKGEFPDWMLAAVINNLKLEDIKKLEDNAARANDMVSAFIWEEKWQDHVNWISEISKITKKEIVEFAKKNYTTNYAIIYKRTGEDKSVQKVTKPEITPVETNRDKQSEFVTAINNIKVTETQPVFVDFSKEITISKTNKQVPVWYKSNTENNLFELHYLIDIGSANDKLLPIAADYLPYLGTSNYDAATLQQEFYKLACSYEVNYGEDQITLSLKGLNDNLEKAITLFEEFISKAKPDQESLDNLILDIIKKREDAKLNKQTILFRGLYNYGMYGKISPFTNILSEGELKQLKAEQVTELIHNLTTFPHKVLYYGSTSADNIVSLLNKLHLTPNASEFKKVQAAQRFIEQPTDSTKVLFVEYDMKQVELIMLSKDKLYDRTQVPTTTIFNEYFGVGMSSIAFQELRESKALAYTVTSAFRIPQRKERSSYFYAYIGTQADKLPEAIKGMTELINNMPASENTFNSVKGALTQKLRTERITKSKILFSYENAQRLGINDDIRKDIFEMAQNYTLNDVKQFQMQHVKNRNYTILVLGKKELLDMKVLEGYGNVTFLTLQDVFGY